jgi:hypothetical protein
MKFVNKIDAWLHFLLAKVRNLVRTFLEECSMKNNISLFYTVCGARRNGRT